MLVFQGQWGSLPGWWQPLRRQCQCQSGTGWHKGAQGQPPILFSFLFKRPPFEASLNLAFLLLFPSFLSSLLTQQHHYSPVSARGRVGRERRPSRLSALPAVFSFLSCLESFRRNDRPVSLSHNKQAIKSVRQSQRETKIQTGNGADAESVAGSHDDAVLLRPLLPLLLLLLAWVGWVRVVVVTARRPWRSTLRRVGALLPLLRRVALLLLRS